MGILSIDVASKVKVKLKQYCQLVFKNRNMLLYQENTINDVMKST